MLKFKDGKIWFKDMIFPTTDALNNYVNTQMYLTKFKEKQRALWKKLQKVKNTS